MGPTLGGTRNSSLMRPLLAVILVSPRTRVPSSIKASSSIFEVVAGKMWPRVSRISEERRTASEKSEVIEVRAARNRLPKLCPSRPDPFSNRCRNSLESRASSSLSATMQLRMSPGGSMLSSLRRRPLDPPSSLTVTTAERSRITGESGGPQTASGLERT